ncbi:hypothetical protein EVAR_14773_1 [Eumeta japonica]|uniref:Uncharacterized protein n=1 Tax=Eumeta variegata TaxID=151549 RepID=A0A4C1TWL7_EUMVA|nr:hypothetical protein EVAR_14773_1 [Eumeta japonica]
MTPLSPPQRSRRLLRLLPPFRSPGAPALFAPSARGVHVASSAVIASKYRDVSARCHHISMETLRRPALFPPASLLLLPVTLRPKAIVLASFIQGCI